MTNILSIQEINARVFWYTTDHDGAATGVKIAVDDFIEFLSASGFRRAGEASNFYFVRCIDNIVTVHLTCEIKDYVYSYINSFPVEEFTDVYGFPPQRIRAILRNRPAFYFDVQKLDSLPVLHRDFVEDDRYTKFMFYENAIIKITEQKVELIPYKKAPGVVWSDQILPRSFHPKHKPIIKRNVAHRFMELVSDQDKPKRLTDLKIIIGYYLHNFVNYKLKMIILTDTGTVHESPNGRSGKTLLTKMITRAISAHPEISPVTVEVNGKQFKTDNKFNYIRCDRSTKLVVLNDLHRRFDTESVFVDITEGISVERKGLQPFVIRPKLIGTINRGLYIDGDSNADRFIEFEFSDYFNASHSPLDEFKQWFFTEWTPDDWHNFDSTMIECVQLFFQNNCELNQPKNEALHVRKFKQKYWPQMFEYLSDVLAVKPGVKYMKRPTYQRFLNEYDIDKKIYSQNKYSYAIAAYNDLMSEFDQWKPKHNTGRDKDGAYFIFVAANP